MREHIITVNDPSFWDEGLWNELTQSGSTSAAIPAREVEVLNERPMMPTMAHFNLTDEEAAQISQDPRVKRVELKADLRNNVKKSYS